MCTLKYIFTQNTKTLQLSQIDMMRTQTQKMKLNQQSFGKTLRSRSASPPT